MGLMIIRTQNGITKNTSDQSHPAFVFDGSGAVALKVLIWQTLSMLLALLSVLQPFTHATLMTTLWNRGEEMEPQRG